MMDDARDLTTLRDLLALGYEGHASALRSGDAFAARYHDRVASRIRRRRTVRHTAIAAAALASVALVTVGAQAAIRVFDVGPAGPIGLTPAPTPSMSPSASPSTSPSASTEMLTVHADGTYIPPLPAGEASGVVTENDVLSLVSDAVGPTELGAPSESVACGSPVVGTYVDPIFDEAGARILKPDTLYPTFLDPAYVTEEGDVLLGMWAFTNEWDDTRYQAQASGEFSIAVSYLSKAIEDAWVYDSTTGLYSGGSEVSYTVVQHQGVVEENDFMAGWTDNIDLAPGGILVRDGTIVGHTDFLAAPDNGNSINEVSASDGLTEIAYDFIVGPLEHVLWCGDRPSGPLDAYAVIGVRPFAQEGFVYSFIWAGRVEYR